MKGRMGILFFLIFGFLFYNESGHTASKEKWHCLMKDPVVLYYHEEDLKNGQKIISIAEQAIPKIAVDLNIKSIRKIIIVISSSEKEFNNLTQGKIPEWGVAAADPLNSVIYVKSPRFARPEDKLQRIVIHELSHVILGMVVTIKNIDRWFDEGFAMYESGEREIGGTILLARSFLTGNYLNLGEIDEVLSFHRSKASLAYWESMAAVEYLINHYGKEILARLVKIIADDKTMDEAFILATGIDFYEFHTQWLEAMKHKYRWYIFLDFSLLLSMSFVILFIAAFLLTKKRIAQKRKYWEEGAEYEVEKMEKDSSSN
jgi:hypothetical protein